MLGDLLPLDGESLCLPCLVDYAWYTLEPAVLGRVPAGGAEGGIELSLSDVGGGLDGDIVVDGGEDDDGADEDSSEET